MKLLLDQNLSRRLLPALEPYFPGSSQTALLKGWPPRVVWLALGNAGNDAILARLLKHREVIADFLVTGHDGVLEID